MTLRDLDIKYTGWLELRRADLFNSWEQTRCIALYSLTHPNLKAPNNFNHAFPNPYAEKKKGKGMSKKEIDKKLKKLDKLEYKEHPMYNGR